MISSKKNPIKIAVLCGGDGSEREVSLRSGEAVCGALNEAGFQAERIDLTSLDAVEGLKGQYDRTFIAMHGDWGEDGRLQSRLEALGIPYTGSRPDACALAMDKWRACQRFRERGLRVPKSTLEAEDCGVIRAELGPHVVVKPIFGGSTVGVSIIRDITPESLAQAVELARESYPTGVFIEEFIGGRELTAAVWEPERGQPQALPVIEIVPHSGFYDYKNKYTAGATEYRVPAPLPPDVAARVADAAVRAHQALGCSAYSRADFRLTPGGEIYILEVNTAPGMTGTSLVPKAAKTAGIPLPEFVRRIVEMTD